MSNQELNNLNLFLSCVVDKQTEEIISQIPFKTYDLRHEGMVGGLKDVVKYLKENRSPKILLVDISESDLPINDISKLAEVCEPGTEVIVVGKRNDVGVFRELVKIGIRDYLVKPLTLNHIVKSIENILSFGNLKEAKSGFERFGKIVSFLGTRGGIGVTSAVVNSAWYLSQKYSRRVCVIDRDLQFGAITQFLNLDDSAGLTEALDAPERIDDSLMDRVMIKHLPHLFVMKGHMELDQDINISPSAYDPIIKYALNKFHYTFFDLPRSFSNPLNTYILDHSNFVIVMTDLSLIGLKETVRYLDFLRRHRTTDQQILVVVNKKGEFSQGEIDPKVFEETIQRKIDIYIPYDNQKLLNSILEGIPAISKGNTPFNESLKTLSYKIMGRVGETEEDGFLNKILNFFFIKNLFKK